MNNMMMNNMGGPQIVQRQVPNNTMGMLSPQQQQVRQQAQARSPKQPRTIYYQMTTKNKTFLDMYHYLKATGRKNCKFMLALIDPDLDGIDPHDPHLNTFYKQKVLRECLCNYWFYLREVARIPSQGGKDVPFILTRANLAVNFCMALNLNVFEELPRQQGKTVSAAARYLYIYNFGTTNSKIGFFHKNMEGSTDNLQTLKDIRDLLPDYLIMKEALTPDGKILKGSNTVQSMKNPHNNNYIKSFPSATNKAKAASLARGKSLTAMWFDEYGFLPYNNIIYMNAMPAFKTAADNCRRNGAPYGILITTTPGFMTTEEGKEACATKDAATRFTEEWYDFTYSELMALIVANNKSDFVYIKYTYQELGCTTEWFNEVCKLLKQSYPDIRREILLEWNAGVENSPFDPDDLDAISRMIKEPINKQYIFKKYLFETYDVANTILFPPIMGVDVSGGVRKDSSTITIIDSETTKVLGCLNCNYISTFDLANVILYIQKHWMPNVVINVERNGGFGQSVISKLAKAGIKKNLYYEIKDVIAEERQDGVHSYKRKMRTKVFGLNSGKEIRKLLIDILMDRVENHKDKIISPLIYNELLGMEIKKSGKVEHSSATHDDQVFSMLMALYVWYEGTDLRERYGIRKTAIKTDADGIDEELNGLDDSVEVLGFFDQVDEIGSVAHDLEVINKASGILMDDFIKQQQAIDEESKNRILSTKIGQMAYRQTNNIPDDVYLDQGGIYTVSDGIYNSFYQDKDDFAYGDADVLAGRPVEFNGTASLDDGVYSYTDHFNF